ncbi:hypothetical protein QJS66_21405 [Kocuria rhizophila]|nr:hypothetical protein QJS66_21405 [Kocuria rhizophila]
MIQCSSATWPATWLRTPSAPRGGGVRGTGRHAVSFSRAAHGRVPAGGGRRRARHEDWVSPHRCWPRPPPRTWWCGRAGGIDGFDIHVFVHRWDAASTPAATSCGSSTTHRAPWVTAPTSRRLIRALAASGRTLLVHDNLGRPHGAAAAGDSTGLRTLSAGCAGRSVVVHASTCGPCP